VTLAALRLFCDNRCNRRSAMRGGTATGVVAGVSTAAAMSATARWASAEATLRGLPVPLAHAWDRRAAAAFGTRLGHTRNASINLSSDCLPDLHRDATAHAVHGSASAGLLAQA